MPGTGEEGSTHTRSREFVMPESGRLIASGGHLHGGGEYTSLSQPDCGNREIGRSEPTWGLPEHPFYNVKPVLHEPGPINMTGFGTSSGIPVAAGQRLRINAAYENTRPHVRVMGIMMAFIAPDPSVTDGCAPLPSDVINVGTNEPGREGPVPYRIPLTGLDKNGEAVTIKAPPGKLKRMPRGGEVEVTDQAFSRPERRGPQGRRARLPLHGLRAPQRHPGQRPAGDRLAQPQRRPRPLPAVQGQGDLPPLLRPASSPDARACDSHR